MSNELEVFFFSIAAPAVCVALGAIVIFAAGLRLHLAHVWTRRAAKRARIDVSERRYHERLAARNSRPAVVLHINQRRATR